MKSIGLFIQSEDSVLLASFARLLLSGGKKISLSEETLLSYCAENSLCLQAVYWTSCAVLVYVLYFLYMYTCVCIVLFFFFSYRWMAVLQAETYLIDKSTLSIGKQKTAV